MNDKIYAVYKENILPLVGGINPEGATIVATYNGWKVIEIDKDDFSKFSEFKLYPINKKIALGLILNGNMRTGDAIDTEIEPEFDENELTDDERKLIEMAKKYMDLLEKKFVVRANVRKYKDFEDDLADTKLLIEFLLGYIKEDYENKSDEEKLKLNADVKEMVENFIEMFDKYNLRIKDDNIINKIEKIIKDENNISKIVKSLYYK
jgi:molybdopterin converting factor small subunit